MSEENNIQSVVDKLAETMDTTISSGISEDDGPAVAQIIVRANPSDRERWKLAANREGKSLAQFIRDVVNDKVTDILDCSHPINMRRYYPWAEFCLRCNARIRG
jgi:cell envelope opacity-associated protein A